MLIFDGDCSFCTSSARWIERRLPEDAEVVAWQFVDDLDALGLTAEEANAKVWWIDPDGRRWGGHLGIGRAFRTAGGFWGVVGLALCTPPLAWVAAPVYRLVARYRHRMPGGTPACRIDSPH